VKVLLDTCVWGGARSTVAAGGHDVEWAGAWDTDPGDDEILARAHAQGQILVTLDKDFGELAIVRGVPHSGIARLVGASAREQGPMCVRILERHGAELAAGAIVTVEPGRVRIRPPAGSVPEG
jgi:predicted nuclease of predicted toxin-antitoxin system